MKNDNSTKQSNASKPMLPAVLFGAKVRFKEGKNIHETLKNKDFCLLGFCDSAIAIIEWENRGQYSFEYYTASLDDLDFQK